MVGARYTPCPVIWPQAIPLHPGPERLQITTLLLVPLTVATNSRLPPGKTPPVLGDRETEIAKAAKFETGSRSNNNPSLAKRLIFPPLPAAATVIPSLRANLCDAFIASAKQFHHGDDRAAIVQLA